MIVVDAGVLEALLLETAGWASARQGFLRDPDWAAPPLWRSDFRRVLAHHTRAKMITPRRDEELFDLAVEVIGAHEIEPSNTVVWELTLTSGLDLYDAEYVAVAKELGVKYVTSDDDVAKAIPDVVIPLRVFCTS